jgi:hypothetical protein
MGNLKGEMEMNEQFSMVNRVVEESYDEATGTSITLVNFVGVEVWLSKKDHGNWRMLLDLLDDMKRYYHAQNLIMQVSYDGDSMAQVYIYKNLHDLISEDWIITMLKEAFPELIIINMFAEID